MVNDSLLLKLGGALVVVILLIINTFFIVKQTEQAIVLQFGELVKITKTPGLHVKVPFVQEVIYFDNRILTVIDEEKELIAKDQKRVIISAYAKYTITNPLKFYQTVKDNSGLKSRLSTILNSALRQIIGDEPLIALLTEKRIGIMNRIQKLVNSESEKFGIDIRDVRILRADLPTENSAAIFKRMQSDREKEAKQLRAQGEEEAQIIISKSNKEKTIILAEANKVASILKGEGDAKSIKIYADATKKDPEFYEFYRSLDAYQKALNNKDTALYMSSGDKFFKFFHEK
jgi:membrane protease subunit HflC